MEEHFPENQDEERVDISILSLDVRRGLGLAHNDNDPGAAQRIIALMDENDRQSLINEGAIEPIVNGVITITERGQRLIEGCGIERETIIASRRS
jgi:hypothetical protein